MERTRFALSIHENMQKKGLLIVAQCATSTAMKQERDSACLIVRLPEWMNKRVRRIAEKLKSRPEEIVRLAIGSQIETVEQRLVAGQAESMGYGKAVSKP